MELAAIRHGCTLSRELNEDQPVEVTIHSDCKAAVLSLRANIFYSSITRDILDHLRNNNRLGVNWIKGHDGIRGNERADALAKEALLLTGEVKNQGGFSHSELKAKIDLYLRKKWQDRWDKEPCRQTKIFYQKTTQKLNSSIWDMTRAQIRWVMSFVSGHCTLNYHWAKLRGNLDPKCRLCDSDADETPEHLIKECSGTEVHRLIYQDTLEQFSEVSKEEALWIFLMQPQVKALFMRVE